MCENKEAEVHAIRRDPFRHLFTHEVFQTPAVKISGYQKRVCAFLVALNHRLPAQWLEAEICLIIIKLKRQQDKTAN